MPDQEKRRMLEAHLGRALQHLDSLRRIKARLHDLPGPPSEEGRMLRQLNEELIAMAEGEIQRHRAELAEPPLPGPGR